MKEENTEASSVCGPPSAAELSRRKFLARWSLAAGGVGAFILAVPMVGFIVAPFFGRKQEVWRAVGKVDSFKIGETTAVNYEDASPLPWAGVTARSAAWLHRVNADTFIAFSINCTHLGCPVRWLAKANLFMCPCHGGVYYENGECASGPPPRGLYHCVWRVADGKLEIQAPHLPTLQDTLEKNA